MRDRILTILFISLLGITQYGRSLSYIGCILENQLETSGTPCDCDQVLAAEKPPLESDLPSNKAHHHLTLDDYCAGNWLTIARQTTPASVEFPCTSADIVSLFLPVASKPPEQILLFPVL